MWQYILGSLLLGVGIGVGTTYFILWRKKKKLMKKASEVLKKLNLNQEENDISYSQITPKGTSQNEQKRDT